MEILTRQQTSDVPEVRPASLKRPGPPGGVRDTNRANRSRCIREAALALYLERGVESVSVDDIMKAARMAKGSFYRYFTDQAGLMEELMAPLHGLLSAALDACARELDLARTSEAQLAAYQRVAGVLSSLLAQHPGEVRLYLQECRAPGLGTRRPVAELARLVTRHAIDITGRAQAHGLLRTLNPAISALTVVGATERLLLALLHREDLGDVGEVPPAVMSALLQGLRR